MSFIGLDFLVMVPGSVSMIRSVSIDEYSPELDERTRKFKDPTGPGRY